MKKIVTFITTLVVLVCVLIFTTQTVYADELNYVNNGGSATSTFTYYEQSTYTVIVPETINAFDESYAFTADNVNITDNEHILVTINNVDRNNDIVFTHENGESQIHKHISTSSEPEFIEEHPNCVGYFDSDETVSQVTFYITNSTNEEYQNEFAKAGNYTAIAEFEISLIQD